MNLEVKLLLTSFIVMLFIAIVGSVTGGWERLQITLAVLFSSIVVFVFFLVLHMLWFL